MYVHRFFSPPACILMLFASCALMMIMCGLGKGYSPLFLFLFSDHPHNHRSRSRCCRLRRPVALTTRTHEFHPTDNERRRATFMWLRECGGPLHLSQKRESRLKRRRRRRATNHNRASNLKNGFARNSKLRSRQHHHHRHVSLRGSAEIRS